MTLRLELKPAKGFGDGAPRQRWYFETGNRTIGRAGDCDWQIPDPKRTVSKLHCVIESDRNGFLLRDKSANGSRVDGVIVHEDETVPLDAGSVVEIGDFGFVVAISGERDASHDDPDADLRLGDDNLTISSILADVAPSARTASGLRGAVGEGEDWLAGVTAEQANSGTPSSRNVEIGWHGAPDTGGFSPVLPDDWNQETETSTRFEHVSATRAPVAVVRSAPVSQEAEAERPVETAPGTDEVEAAVVAGTTHPDTPPVPAADLHRLGTLLARCEEASGELFSRLGMDADGPSAASFSFSDSGAEALALRLDALLQDQMRLALALDGMFARATRQFDPSMLEALIDAEPRRLTWGRELPWLRDRTYWQAYCAQFEDEGGRLSVHDLLCRAARQALQEQDSAEAIPQDDDREVDAHR
ncbi:FHA domain-containing protein [Nitratireductor sp. ZSWI3]|uniref:FHA domain-containing protein n=1 Tax=Nitratireductor sp. ZSWI3 TaxID=2966359 RepID=UPI00215014B7|nr:FHA domain-containing protein [Nitratireductor sp. ZSWI3]MCR4266310.1 FHA domain-containing protein [Nitratireductor sp. ZSWI3]